MEKHKITLPRLAAFGALLVILTACGGGGGGQGGTETLGSTFQRAFGQGPNDTPIDVTNAGLRIDLTRDPFEL